MTPSPEGLNMTTLTDADILRHFEMPGLNLEATLDAHDLGLLLGGIRTLLSASKPAVPTDADLDRVAEEIMKGMRAIALWQHRKTYAVRVMREEFSVPAAPAQSGEPVAANAARDVLAERNRQMSAEGWTPEHDDEHSKGELARAAACYAAHASHFHLQSRANIWPWARDWWKPTTPRRDLVKAGALILAEIERLDRAAPQPSQTAVVLDDERAAFEAHMRSRDETYLFRRDTPGSTRLGQYCRQSVQDQWETWQARAVSPQPVEQPGVISEAFKQWFESEWSSYQDKAISDGKITSMAWALKGYRAAQPVEQTRALTEAQAGMTLPITLGACIQCRTIHHYTDLSWGLCAECQATVQPASGATE